MPDFRFIHAADIHLDSPLKGLANLEGRAADLIRSATREAFEALVTRAVEERADFLIIAGDLYDGDWRDYQTGLFFVRQMGRLRDAGIPAYLIYGNHDAESKITRSLTLPDSTHVFPTRSPGTFRIDRIDVALHGQGFKERDTRANLARAYPPAVRGAFNIGILHTGLAGAEGHAPYAPCSLEELRQKGYDYWALGHIHKPEVLSEDPHVVFAGNLQGRHIREAGPRGAMLVTVEDGAVRALEHFHVDVVRWALVEVGLDGAESDYDANERIRAAIEKAVEEQSDGRLLACRIVLSGRTPAHDALLAARENLLAEAQAAAAALGDETAWTEKLLVQTARPAETAPDPALAGALGDVTLAQQDEALLRDLREQIAPFVHKLPPEVRNAAESQLLRAARESDFSQLIELARPYAMARLTGRTG
ncbi:MAG: DNA repair exonuclease [Bryobacterales bacterium]|nr:DNA repair exonuclease [Bryobacterales bacterium]